MENLDIITLDNQKDYCILKKLEYDYDTYFLLNEIDKDENLLNKQIIMKLFGEKEMILVTDSEEYNKIKDIFISLLINEEEE